MRKDTDSGIVEHHPSCQARCVAECGASPRRAHVERGPRVRTLHTAAVEPQKPAPPLWEHVADWGAVTHHRDVGCDIVTRDGVRTLIGLPLPLPETYIAYDRADEQYSLERWTRTDGVEDRALDSVIAAVTAERKSHARSAPDVDQIAAMVRRAFPGFTTERDKRPVAAVVKRGTARQRQMLALVTGEATAERKPSQWAPMHEATRHVRDVMTVHIWALALILFGRERDTLSDYALGRLLKGEPVKDVRAPFASAAHALSVAERDLPGLGGGSCAWPTEDPRMRLRTWAKTGEMSVRGGHHGTDSIRGEHGVNRVLDARNVERRAGLAPHERAAVAVLCDRNLTRDEKALRLREVEAVRRGIAVPEDPKALREATADVSDGQLYSRAKAAEKRVREAVDRVSREGDALAPKREERARRREPDPAMPARGALPSEVFAP